MVFHPRVGDDETFDTEGNVAEESEERHLEIVEALDVRDRIDPLREGVDIPHLPDESANERRDRKTNNPRPVARRDVIERARTSEEHFQEHHHHERRDPEKRIRELGNEHDADKSDC